jgi:transcription-repair coupling factor (superfamily II helicase)
VPGGKRPQKTSGFGWFVTFRGTASGLRRSWSFGASTLSSCPIRPSENGDGAIADPESAAEWFSILEILARSELHGALRQRCVFRQGSLTCRAALQSDDSQARRRIGSGTELAKSLTDHGYERVPSVTARGQFAVRGGIIDLFAWQAAKPLRLEFFDTDLESVREFDLDSQASTTRLLEAELLLAEPATEASIADYRRAGDLVVSFGAEIANPDVRIIEGRRGIQQRGGFHARHLRQSARDIRGR